MKDFYKDNAALIRIWSYLWNTYKDNGGVPRDISDAITLIQDRITGAR